MSNHYSENEIELLVLNGRKTTVQHNEFFVHANYCKSCRELYEEISHFYSSANAGQKLLESAKEETSLIATPTFIHPKRLVVITKEPLPMRIWWFVRRNPFTSGMSLAAMVVFFWFGNRMIEMTVNGNPTYYRFNEVTEKMEIYDENDQVLWDTPIRNAKGLNQDMGNRVAQRIAICDLNGDQKNEVITTLPIGRRLDSLYVLQVYDSEKRLIFENEVLSKPFITFNGVEYKRSFNAGGLLTLKVHGEQNIFVSANNYRSPTIIARLDHNGNILGRYWHFGQIGSLQSLDVDGDGNEELIFIGMNDVSYPDITFGIVAVLDPEKIAGDTESSASMGFGFPQTTCEKYYIRIPRSDVDTALNFQAIPYQLFKDNDVISIVVKSGNGSLDSFTLEYIFSTSMKVLYVKGDDPSARIYDLLKSDKKVSSTYGIEYFNRIKNNIQYWDGKKWVQHYTSVTQQSLNPTDIPSIPIPSSNK